MIIAVDGYEANVRERVGIGRYAYEILKHLFEEVKSQKSKVKSLGELLLRIYLPSSPLPDMPKETTWWQYRVARPTRFWTFIGLPLALTLDRPRPDIIFSPTHYAPRFVAIPRIIAIMDTSYLHFPEMFRARDLHQLVHGTAYSVRQAARILTISQASKDAIIAAYGVPPDRVVVTYPGITMKQIQNSKLKVKSVKKKYKLPENYILSVGTIQPRKNYVRLIEAFARSLKLLSSQYPDISLVIVGKPGWLYEEILTAPQRLGVAKRVKFLNFVPERDLPHLYQGALVFALPSLYEGFGLPVLEAMASHCPVVVSRVSSLPEIAGRAAIYVNPEEVSSIADGLIQAIKEHGTKAESDRIAKGLARTRKFSWENAAKKTLAVFEKVAKERKV
ncbi:MAG: glycosyltransferase family 4 protein [Patescibacteria group bacterium]